MQLIQLHGLHGLAVDAVLPLLVDPAQTDVLMREQQQNVQPVSNSLDVWSVSRNVTFPLLQR